MVNTERYLSYGMTSLNYNILNIVVNTELNNIDKVLSDNYNILNIVVNTELWKMFYLP